MKIIPAILEKDFSEIKNKLQFLSKLKLENNLKELDLLQIDLCDGEFVKNKTWLPDFIFADAKEMDFLRNFQKENNIGIEYHLMCEDQKRYFLEAKQLEAKSIVIHTDKYFKYFMEEYDLHKDILDFVKDSIKFNFKLAFCFDNNLLIENERDFSSFLGKLLELRNKIWTESNFPFVLNFQFMGIEKIGMQGQIFDHRVLQIINLAKSIKLKRVDIRDIDNPDTKEDIDSNIRVQIDGGINIDSAKLVKKSNVDSIIVGSFLMKELNSDTFLEKYKNLKKI